MRETRRGWIHCCDTILIGVTGVVLCFSRPVSAEEPTIANPELKTRIARLLRELDADQRPRRINAERELLDLGPALLNELPAPDLIANPAVRTSVAKIRKTLELRKATQSVRASVVTTAAGITFANFLKEAERQTANSIDGTRLTPTQMQAVMTQDFREIPFWTALDATLKHAGASVDFRPDASSLLLQSLETVSSPRELGVVISGPFRVALLSLKPRPIAGSDQKRLRAEFSVTPEPRLRALFLKFQAKDFSALTTNGRTLQPADPEAQLDLPLGEGGHHVNCNLDFLIPAGCPLEELVAPRITGKATMQVAAGTEHIRIRDVAKAQGVSRRRGGVTVSVLSVKTREISDMARDVSIQIQVAYDTGGPAFESHRTWIFHNQVYLEPLEGAPISVNGGYETDLQANGVVGVTYRFKGIPIPLDQLQFVYVAPTLMIDVPLTFELQPRQNLGNSD